MPKLLLPAVAAALLSSTLPLHAAKGVPFVALFGTNKIASIDPKTLAIREYALPDLKARPRRIAFTSDDVVWYSDFPRGYLGRLDPATGEVKEWQSPSGPRS